MRSTDLKSGINASDGYLKCNGCEALIDHRLVSCDRKLVSCACNLTTCDRELVSCDRKLLSCDEKIDVSLMSHVWSPHRSIRQILQSLKVLRGS